MNVSCSFCPRSTPVFRARDTAACWMGFRPRARTGRSILRSEVDSDDAMVAGEQWSRCRPVARPLRFQVDTRPTLAAGDGRSRPWPVAHALAQRSTQTTPWSQGLDVALQTSPIQAKSAPCFDPSPLRPVRVPQLQPYHQSLISVQCTCFVHAVRTSASTTEHNEHA